MIASSGKGQYCGGAIYDFSSVRLTGKCHRPTSTSDAARPSSSNDRPSPLDACCIVGRPLNITKQRSQGLP